MSMLQPEYKPDRPAPFFSVVTVSYNQAGYIKDNIESVLAQDYPEFEHIVVDGGSKDNSREVCEAYDHVEFILADGTTQSEALNIGFKKARGDIIAWLNSDDYYTPGTFHRVAKELDLSRNRWIVAGAAQVVDEHGNKMWVLRNGRVPFRRLVHHPKLYPHNGWMVMPCQPSVFFHKRVQDRVGLLEPKLRYSMDYEYWLRMLSRGYRFHYVPQVFSAYRLHSESHTSKGYDTFLSEWGEVAQDYLNRCTPLHQLGLKLWWVYARMECFFVKRHKAAIKHVAERFGAEPGHQPLPARIMVVARATLTAPWTPLAMLWLKVYHRFSPIYRTP